MPQAGQLFRQSRLADTLVLMDEVLTPDSSRYWPVEGYAEGRNPSSFDKQFLRDWLETTTVNGQPRLTA